MKKFMFSALVVVLTQSCFGFDWGKPNRVADNVFADAWADGTTNAPVTIIEMRAVVASLYPVVFNTNTVVVETIYTPAGLGQFQAGATNLYIAVTLTTNGWLKIK